MFPVRLPRKARASALQYMPEDLACSSRKQVGFAYLHGGKKSVRRPLPSLSSCTVIGKRPAQKGPKPIGQPWPSKDPSALGLVRFSLVSRFESRRLDFRARLPGWIALLPDEREPLPVAPVIDGAASRASWCPTCV